MSRKGKLALLALLTLTFLALSLKAVSTAAEVLKGQYEVASDGIELLAFLIFLAYTNAELLFYLRERFEADYSESERRIVFLIYLIVLLIYMLLALFYFGSKVDVEMQPIEYLGEGIGRSIPPEVASDTLPQIIINTSAVSALEDESGRPHEYISSESSFRDALLKELRSSLALFEDFEREDLSSSQRDIERREEIPLRDRLVEELRRSLASTSFERIEDVREEEISSSSFEKESDEEVGSLVSEISQGEREAEKAEEESVALSIPSILIVDEIEEREIEGEEETTSSTLEKTDFDVLGDNDMREGLYVYSLDILEIDASQAMQPSIIVPTYNEIGRRAGLQLGRFRILPNVPSAPQGLTVVDQDIVEPFVFIPSFAEEDEDDFWASFFIAGEDELFLEDGIYYMDLYINNNYYGVVTTYIFGEEVSILKSELLGFVSGLLTDDAYTSLSSSAADTYTLDYLESVGVRTAFNSDEYRIDLFFDPSDMPIQTISIRSSGFHVTRRPISGADTLNPATFVLRSRYNLTGSFDFYPFDNFVSSLYFAFNSYNEARLYDFFFVFNYYMNFSPRHFNFSLGSYYLYHDFTDQSIRLTVGNVSNSLLSLPGTNIGIRFDKAYEYGPSGARRRGNIERMIYVEKESDVRIYNEGREIFRRTLDPGSYRITEFILYSGSNHITVLISPIDGSAPTELEMDINYASSLLSVGEFYYGASLSTSRNIVTQSTETEGALHLPFFDNRVLEYDFRDWVLSGYINAGVTETFTLDVSLAAMNNATSNAAFNPSLSSAIVMTHANAWGTTRYNLNASGRGDGYGNMAFNELYARIAHQITTRNRALSSVNLSLTYRLDSQFRNRVSGTVTTSGAFSIFNWSLSGTATYQQSGTSNWTVSGSLGFSPLRGLRISASANVNGTFDAAPTFYARVYGSYSFGGSNINANASTNDAALAYSYYNDRHSVYTRMYTNDYYNAGNFNFSADYSYRGNVVDMTASVIGYDMFNLSSTGFLGNASISLSTASVFADGLIAFASSIPADFILVKQEGSLKGNTLSVGAVGSSVSSEIPLFLDFGMYTGISANSALTFYSQSENSLLGGESFDVVIPDTKIAGYALRLEAEEKYASAVFVVLPDCTPWINNSSPLSKIEITEDGIVATVTEDYVFTDGMGIIINNSLEAGLYGFDVRYNGAWYLYIFSVDDNEGQSEFVQIKENATALTDLNIISDAYFGAYMLESSRNITSEEFWNILYPGVEVAA